MIEVFDFFLNKREHYSWFVINLSNVSDAGNSMQFVGDSFDNSLNQEQEQCTLLDEIVFAL